LVGCMFVVWFFSFSTLGERGEKGYCNEWDRTGGFLVLVGWEESPRLFSLFLLLSLVNCFSLLTFLGIPGGLVFFFFSLLEHTNCFFLFLREELSVFL
jgi:hypothetical protein